MYTIMWYWISFNSFCLLTEILKGIWVFFAIFRQRNVTNTNGRLAIPALAGFLVRLCLCFHHIPLIVPLSCANMDSSAGRAERASPLHTCCCVGIKYPWAVFSSLVYSSFYSFLKFIMYVMLVLIYFSFAFSFNAPSSSTEWIDIPFRCIVSVFIYDYKYNTAYIVSIQTNSYPLPDHDLTLNHSHNLNLNYNLTQIVIVSRGYL